MGLASKLAAANQAGGGGYPGNPPYPGGPATGGQSQGYGQGSYPGQTSSQAQSGQQYQAYPGGPPSSTGPQQGQGYPPQGQGYPPQGQQYGAPPPQQSQPARPQDIQAYKQLLISTIQERGLQSLYPPNSPALDQIAQRASSQVDKLCQQWRVHNEIGRDIVKLALYDIILYIDDSGSMAFEEDGERIDDLKLILSRVAFAATLFDDDGVTIRFMNSSEQGNNIRNDAEVNALIQRINFNGLTPMGTQLREKVVDPFIVQPARSGNLKKPVLVITITDGQPAGEAKDAVFDTIRYTSKEVSRRYTKGCVAFQFAQVGTDLKAQEFLSRLDEAPGIGDLVDCTSSYEVEAGEMKRANPPVTLTPELWLIKLLLGAIDSSYDTKDEKSGARPPPGGGYGGPPPPQYGGGYGQQQGGYPPQQGYGGPGGYPGQQQGGYGRPPPPAPGGYPPQGGYPGQQGGYGAPPPPPRY